MEKIKQFVESERGKDILTVLIVILVGLGSFELGRLSKEFSSSRVKIEGVEQGARLPDGQANALSAVNSLNTLKASNLPAKAKVVTGNYFASNRGQKYYPNGCSAGNTIKEENRVYFATEADAIKAGYEKSSSCK